MYLPCTWRKWLVAAAFGGLLGAGLNVFAREWSDVSGKFHIEAEFVAARNGKAILEKTDGSIITVPLEKLSEADRAYIRSQNGTKPAPVPARSRSRQARSSLRERRRAAEAALTSLRTHCYRCHGQEGANEGGFNFVLNLEKLARTHVTPKSLADSLLFERLVASDDSVMPPPGEEPRPSKSEIAAIKGWIEAGARRLQKTSLATSSPTIR